MFMYPVALLHLVTLESFNISLAITNDCNNDNLVDANPNIDVCYDEDAGRYLKVNIYSVIQFTNYIFTSKAPKLTLIFTI